MEQKCRPPCPFYGFFMVPSSVMLDQGGNQCALLVDSYSPCEMFSRRLSPNWKECPLNDSETQKDITNVLDKVRVHPDEYRNSDNGEGISLKEWSSKVMEEGNGL